MGNKVEKICEHCGSDNIVLQGYTRWNVERQEWVIEELEEIAFCDDCELFTNEKSIKPMEKDELDKIAKRLSELEVELKHTYGLKNISGAFVSITMDDYTDEHIYITISDGVQNEEGSRIAEEEATLDRHTLKFID